MAEVKPLRALHYDPASVGSFEAVIAPPYDVIDAELRAQLLGQSAKNVVEIDLPEAPGGGDIYEHAAAHAGAVARRRHGGAGRRAGLLGAGAGLRRPRRLTAPAARLLRTRARGGLWPRPDPPARAHPPGAQGGPAAPDASDEGQPVADLQPVPRPRRPRRQGHRGRGDRRAVRPRRRPRGHPERDVAGERPGRGGRAGVGAGRGRAADRRRPPPLRDRARVRRRDRRRGRPPLRADVPGVAERPGAAGVPDPPAADRPQGRRAQAGGHPRHADAGLRPGGDPGGAARARAPATISACAWATWTPSTSRGTR